MKLPARNTTAQLLTLYTDPERHNAQCYRRTDTWTDGQTTLWCQETTTGYCVIDNLIHAPAENFPGVQSLLSPFSITYPRSFLLLWNLLFHLAYCRSSALSTTKYSTTNLSWLHSRINDRFYYRYPLFLLVAQKYMCLAIDKPGQDRRSCICSWSSEMAVLCWGSLSCWWRHWRRRPRSDTASLWTAESHRMRKSQNWPAGK